MYSFLKYEMNYFHIPGSVVDGHCVNSNKQEKQSSYPLSASTQVEGRTWIKPWKNRWYLKENK